MVANAFCEAMRPADSTVAEIEAVGGTALGVEVDVTDHAAVAVMVARGPSPTPIPPE